MPASHDPDFRDLEGFAAAFADALPGDWTSEYRSHATTHSDHTQLTEGVWDMDLVSDALARRTPRRSTVLTYGEARLFVIENPDNQEEFLVAAMAPPGVAPEAFRGVREPDGITVPDDPYRAADEVLSDLLPRYDTALGRVRSNFYSLAETTSTPTDHVTMTWGSTGELTATVTSPEAADILHGAGFVHDRDEDVYVLSGDDTFEQARAVRKAGAQLRAYGIGVSLAHPPRRTGLTATASPRVAPSTAATARAR